MADSSWWQTLGASLLTAAFTLAGTNLQQAHQDERADKSKFLDGAQATAQETSRLLYDGYNALDKLLKEINEKGWNEFSHGPWDEYMQFQRNWRQQLIAEHFRLSRYFGKNMANELVHIDEIDIHPITNHSSPNPCSPPGDEKDYDVEKLSDQIECYARLATLEQDIINENLKDQKAKGLYDALGSKRNTEESAWNLLQHYDKFTVNYLRRLDATLTELGASKVTVILNKS
ncbi:hypothetical protein FBY06_11494 [Pseudomonas sp. SJZ085]|uniref:hypothetical protein n=1 Tax=unclassified Pseudomonas TaxID=196821 RepID=UPI001199C7A0|nr:MULTISPECIES: hypothetical protein [unclassified Pseudomonas]TWC18638.1 hypothetical protein FBX99_11494 [Pseudomonas sp. SJZ074]TWC36421.1 hypothetical protein FBY06_11494 [Pseudomonas sp. SJZ085]